MSAIDWTLERLRDEVWGELIACYGEGENTDWPYLTDLCDLIVGLILKHQGEGASAAQTGLVQEQPAGTLATTTIARPNTENTTSLGPEEGGSPC